MDRLALLKQLSFGSQVAEDETAELARYFVETFQWAKIARGEADIIRGEKGSGKSAIYSLLIERQSEFFDNRILLVGAENPRGDTVFRDIVPDPPASEREFIILWKLYISILIARELREYGLTTAASEAASKQLEDAKLLSPANRAGILKVVQEYARKLFLFESLEGGITFDPNTGIPNGLTGKIVSREPTAELQRKGITSVDALLDHFDDALGHWNYELWILLDRLDVAFIENHTLEANALRALIRVYGDFRRLKNVALKIFLREDIWKRVMESGYREASHLVRYDNLQWNPPSLLNLLMRRILANEAIVEEYGIDAAQVLGDAKRQEELFNTLFPKQVEQGPQKATTFNWMVTRCADASKKTAPRELIHLLNCIRDEEIKRLERGGASPPDRQLFDRSVFKAALPTVSDARLQQYLYAEYPSQRPFLENLDGQKAEQTAESLSALWSMSRAEATEKAAELVELGVFEARTSTAGQTYWVPFLYRDALHLVQGRAEADAEC